MSAHQMTEPEKFEEAIRECLAVIDASRPATRFRSDQLAAAIRGDLTDAGLAVNRDTAGAFFHACGWAYYALVDVGADRHLRQGAHAILLGAATLIREIDQRAAKGGAS